MRVDETPFRAGWWGIDLADVEARPNVGTYGNYEHRALPPLPFELTGDFAWLAGQRKHREWPIGEDGYTGGLKKLIKRCAKRGLTLPPSFVTFMSTPKLQKRVRSSTACYLDLAEKPVPMPAAQGHLITFLADQQGCLYWYLYLADNGAGHAVVSSEDHYAEVEPDGTEGIEFCAESFEEFIARYWLENEIWFAENEGDEMPEPCRRYVESYRQTS
ncbi:hypothetical protein [Actinoplanes sp. NPDC051851]|uniref:hypothetical protein n=1 Tax=Actinoplanes sp. NPDC051851 TaxID=3154753 RepID=UPI0034325FE6